MCKPFFTHAWRLALSLGIASLAFAASLSVARSDILPGPFTARSGSMGGVHWSYTPSLTDRPPDGETIPKLFINEDKDEAIKSVKFIGEAGQEAIDNGNGTWTITNYEFPLASSITPVKVFEKPKGSTEVSDTFFLTLIEDSNGQPTGDTLLSNFNSGSADGSAADTEGFRVKNASQKVILAGAISSPCEGGNGPCALIIPEGSSLGFLATGLLPLGLLALKRRFGIGPPA